MCTIIAALEVWPERPVVIAANRDERLDRPAEGPSVRTIQGRRVLAPRDQVAGGTWLGVNDAGLFVGVTNRFSGPPDPSRRSRGLLVADALAQSDAARAAEVAAAHGARAHNPFHLLMADRTGAELVWDDGEALHRRRLEPGLFVLTERSLGAAPTRRPETIERAMADLMSGPFPGQAALTAVLRIQAPEAVGPGSLDGVWVHVPSFNYGTRSSTFVELGGPDGDQLHHAEGPPPDTPWTDHSDQLRRLLASS